MPNQSVRDEGASDGAYDDMDEGASDGAYDDMDEAETQLWDGFGVGSTSVPPLPPPCPCIGPGAVCLTSTAKHTGLSLRGSKRTYGTAGGAYELDVAMSESGPANCGADVAWRIRIGSGRGLYSPRAEFGCGCWREYASGNQAADGRRENSSASDAITAAARCSVDGRRL
jgi:hypothetical protein